MISSAPFRRLLSEKELTLRDVSAMTGYSIAELSNFLSKNSMSMALISELCLRLRCQPCDLIEFSKTETKGHWEWVEEKKE